MVKLPELESLARRRAQLTARADVYRQMLALEARMIGAQTSTARRWIARARAIWPVASSIASLVALSRRARSANGSEPSARLGGLAPWIARFQLARDLSALARTAWSRR